MGQLCTATLNRLADIAGDPSTIRCMGGDWNRLVRQRGQAQHGVVSTEQAIGCGISPATFRRHAREHAWDALHHGVWALPGSSDTYTRQAAAAVLTAGGIGLLTARSTLHLLGALHTRPSHVDLLLPPEQHRYAREGIRHFRGRWVEGDQPTTVDGLPSVPPVRALTDFAAVARRSALERVLASLHRLRLATPEEVAVYLGRRGRFPGRTVLVDALASVAGELTHSRDEQCARRLLDDGALPLRPHPRPLLVEHRGSRIAEIDIPFPQVRYGVEVDGPHHLLAEVADADKRRDRRLSRLGWVVDRFSIDEIAKAPQDFVAQVGAGLSAAMARDTAPWPVE